MSIALIAIWVVKEILLVIVFCLPPFIFVNRVNNSSYCRALRCEVCLLYLIPDPVCYAELIVRIWVKCCTILCTDISALTINLRWIVGTEEEIWKDVKECY